MENEMIQRSVPNEPLEGMPEEYEDPELLEEKLEEEVGESEGIVIDAGDDEEIMEERPEHLKAAKGKKYNPTLNKQKKQISKPKPKPISKPDSKASSKPSTSSNDFKGNPFQQEALKRHNEYRKKHHVNNLILDKELCSIAQQYANKLAATDVFQHSKNNFKGKPMGENLYCCYGMECTGNGMTDSWYNEIKLYDFNKPGWSSATGHFTQVVWKGTKKIGFGVAKSQKGYHYGVACYFPAGNYINFFPQNVLKK